jgi:hypothetical protein
MQTRKFLTKLTVISGILMVCSAAPLFAPPQEVHDSDLTRILLGVPFVQFPEHEANLSLLEQAAYLTIDQFNGHNLFYLDNLRNAGVKNLPQGAEIDFTAGGEHQRYTHRGWDYNTYPVNYSGYNYSKATFAFGFLTTAGYQWILKNGLLFSLGGGVGEDWVMGTENNSKKYQPEYKFTFLFRMGYAF